jgi:hypothetical protein
MAFGKYLGALWKHWWALMSSAVFTAIGVYGAWQQKGNSWIVGVSFAAAIALFFVASFKAWNEEHKARDEAEESLNDVSPKLYIEYSETHASHFLTHSGLIVRNTGKRVALKVILSCERTKVRLLFKDMPIQKIDPDKGESVLVLAEHSNEENGLWYPIGGTPGEQVRTCLDWLNNMSQAEVIPVTITYTDYGGKEYAKSCTIQREGKFLGTGRIWCELDPAAG